MDQRVTIKLKNPNPLFEKWLTEWRDRAKQSGESKMQYSLNLALQSLKKYPIPLESGKECKILKGFGDKICQRLDKKLKEYNKNDSDEDIDADETVLVTNYNTENKKIMDTNKIPNKSQHSRTKEYCPKYRSGAYAILIALYEKSLETSYPGFLTKEKLIHACQHLCDHSFTKPQPDSRYTAWSSMKTLISKNLVIRKSNPAKFFLTKEGINLSQKLYDKGEDVPNNSSSEDFLHKAKLNDVPCLDLEEEYTVNIEKTQTASNLLHTITTSEALTSNSKKVSQVKNVLLLDKYQSSSFSSTSTSVGSSTSSKTNSKSKSKSIKKYPSTSSTTSTQSVQEECIVFSPNSFDIILYVDKQEISGKGIQDDPILAYLQKFSVFHEVKHLKVGDFAWICRSRETDLELVLPYIVERKRMDDFASSIKDGRYHEQKFRLKKSGAEHIIYLIESHGSNDHNLGLPLSTLLQAATNTAIQEGLMVKFTENIKGTAEYLASFSKMLVKLYKAKTVVSCPKENLSSVSLNDDLVSLMTFKEFNQSSSKTKRMTVTDLFVKILIQVKGMSVDRALAIVEVYATPKTLRNAYECNTTSAGEKLLANIKFGNYNKTIGTVLSKTVFQLFTKSNF